MAKLEYLYDKILRTIPIVKDVDPNEWTITNSMMYIAYKYKEKFGQDFVFTFDSVPSKCIEYKMTSRCWMMLGAKAGDGSIVKGYVDWFYGDYKGKRRFTSMGALAKPNLISEYKEVKSKPVEVKTAAVLPGDIVVVLQQFEDSSYIKTYGDLYFFMENLKSDKELNLKFDPIKNKMVDAGFNFDVLNQII